jgi:hypothetical protein
VCFRLETPLCVFTLCRTHALLETPTARYCVDCHAVARFFLCPTARPDRSNYLTFEQIVRALLRETPARRPSLRTQYQQSCLHQECHAPIVTVRSMCCAMPVQVGIKKTIEGVKRNKCSGHLFLFTPSIVFIPTQTDVAHIRARPVCMFRAECVLCVDNTLRSWAIECSCILAQCPLHMNIFVPFFDTRSSAVWPWVLFILKLAPIELHTHTHTHTQTDRSRGFSVDRNRKYRNRK